MNTVSRISALMLFLIVSQVSPAQAQTPFNDNFVPEPVVPSWFDGWLKTNMPELWLRLHVEMLIEANESLNNQIVDLQQELRQLKEVVEELRQLKEVVDALQQRLEQHFNPPKIWCGGGMSMGREIGVDSPAYWDVMFQYRVPCKPGQTPIK